VREWRHSIRIDSGGHRNRRPGALPDAGTRGHGPPRRGRGGRASGETRVPRCRPRPAEQLHGCSPRGCVRCAARACASHARALRLSKRDAARAAVKGHNDGARGKSPTPGLRNLHARFGENLAARCGSDRWRGFSAPGRVDRRRRFGGKPPNPPTAVGVHDLLNTLQGRIRSPACSSVRGLVRGTGRDRPRGAGKPAQTA